MDSTTINILDSEVQIPEELRDTITNLIQPRDALSTESTHECIYIEREISPGIKILDNVAAVTFHSEGTTNLRRDKRQIPRHYIPSVGLEIPINKLNRDKKKEGKYTNLIAGEGSSGGRRVVLLAGIIVEDSDDYEGVCASKASAALLL